MRGEQQGRERARGMAGGPAVCAGELETLLAARLERSDEPWGDRYLGQAPVGVVAAALWHAGRRSSLVARGLLGHWDARLRVSGLQGLAEARGLSRGERFDVVRMLHDREPGVRDFALATVRGWRDGFALALPRLVLAQRAQDRAFAASSKVAVDRWLREAVTADAAGADVLARACAVLRGEAPAAGRPQRSAGLGAQRIDFVYGCRDLPAESLSALAEFLRMSGFVDADVATACVTWLAATDEEGW